MLRRIARSHTMEESEIAIVALKDSSIWKNPANSKLVQYLEMYWLNIKERWVQAYRQNRILIDCNTNNGTERQNKSIKYQYLSKHNKTSLTVMLTQLIEQFLVDKYKKYCDGNMKMSSHYRLYSSKVPEFIKNRPRDMVEHCLKKIDLAESIDESTVIQIGNGKFKVRSCTKNPLIAPYIVDFGDNESMPMCTCPEWRRSTFPCKHFFAVFKKSPIWNWHALSPQYINSPFFCLDEAIINNFIVSSQVVSTSQSSNQEVKTTFLGNSNENMKAEYANLEVNHGAKCRSLLNEIQNHTYLIDGKPEFWSEILKSLTDIKNKIIQASDIERGVILIPDGKKDSKIKKKKMYVSKTFHTENEKIHLQVA